MKKRDDLFHLIKAMSKSEKRYFTLDAKKSSSKGSKYLVLFQAVNDMEIYDEAKLKKKFGKNLRYDKSYLYEAIMRSMRDYRSANSFAARIKEMILDAKYLDERGLYEQCGERLHEAKQLAVELDDQLSLLEINKAERLLIRQTKGKNYAKEIAVLIQEKEVSVNAIEEELRYEDYLDRLYVDINKRFELKREEEIREFKNKYPVSLFEASSLDLSARAKLRYYQSCALYYQLLRDSDQVLNHYSKVVDWWDQYEKIKIEEFYKYIIDVSNLLHGFYAKEAYHEFPALIEKLEKETPRNHHDQGVVFQKATIYKLLYYINTGFDEGIEEVVEGVKSGLDKYQISAGSRNVLIFNTSVMLFMLEKFEQCVVWNTRIIRGDKYITRRDIRNGVMLLNLVATYELENIDKFESFQRAIYRYFAKHGTLETYRFESRILSFFRELAAAPTGEIPKLYRNLRDYLIQIKNNPEVKVSLGLDELLLLWVNSKLEEKSIIMQIKEKNSNAVA
ncbi:MAG: hypothetical protein HRU41_27395 [Saprospiraceae bacterium]|nr:hypothetical protein [Saprospiraceae bacterium]